MDPHSGRPIDRTIQLAAPGRMTWTHLAFVAPDLHLRAAVLKDGCTLVECGFRLPDTEATHYPEALPQAWKDAAKHSEPEGFVLLRPGQAPEIQPRQLPFQVPGL